MSIKNGRYRLRNQASDTYFDVPAKGGNAGKAHGWHGMANNLNQEWDIEQVGGKYRIKNAGTGKWVDAENGGRDNGRVITSDHARLWDLKEDGGAIAVIIPETGTAIDLDFGHSTDGASISVWRFMSNKRYQHWVFEMVLIDPSQLELREPILKSVEYLISNGRYHIKNYASNTYLDVPAQGPNAGKAHGWAGSSDNANQQWVVEMSLGKYYTIKNYRTGKWLNVEKIDGGGRVITSDHPRLWEIRHNGVGTAILIPDNHAAIDLHNGQKNNGAPISVWKIDYGKDHQRWMFEPVKTTPWRH